MKFDFFNFDKCNKIHSYKQKYDNTQDILYIIYIE